MEIGITGTGPLTFSETPPWQWQIFVYLFLAGLTAGIMVFGTLIRARKIQGFDRALRIGEMLGIPFIVASLLVLFSHLGNGWNAWRFYTEFKVGSPMSWASWILLWVMFVLFLRSTIHVLDLRPATGWLSTAWLEKPWALVGWIGRIASRWSRTIDTAAIVLGTAFALYTGFVLSGVGGTRPVWEIFALAPFFLASVLAFSGAFLLFFVEREPERSRVRWYMLLGAAEVVLIGALVAVLLFGPAMSPGSADLLMDGGILIAFWLLAVVAGILVPVAIEAGLLKRHQVHEALKRAAPYLKFSGSALLRFVIIYAGLERVL